MKTHRVDNYRVVVMPEEPWLSTDRNAATLRRTCEDLIRDIKRHVDDIQSITWKCDEKDVCSFCGREWEEETDGSPLCCNAAIAEYEAAR